MGELPMCSCTSSRRNKTVRRRQSPPSFGVRRSTFDCNARRDLTRRRRLGTTPSTVLFLRMRLVSRIELNAVPIVGYGRYNLVITKSQYAVFRCRKAHLAAPGTVL